ncbi:MAG: RNA polymerase sigma factor [Planctomycetota bacterium]|jgi:RNA polymerase sigma-70 factor (ECF subfamily)
MPDTESDERLMGRLTGGEGEALAELVNRYQGPLWCFIDRMCSALGVTDDVYQEVWTRIYIYRKGFKPDGNFRRYLFTVAVNCCRTALKRRRWRLLDFNTVDEPADPDPPPAERLMADEDRRALHRAIDDLPRRQRSVVLLYLLYSTDYERIATVLDARAATVRSHMSRALRRLRGNLSRIPMNRESQVDHERSVH